jgi:GNAT superfamily N-acetyltransferase
VNVRALTTDDADAVATLARADELAFRGHSHVAAADVLDWWSRGDLADSWLFEEDGAVAGAGWFAPWGDKGTIVGIVAQQWKGHGIGSEIVERGEACARRRGLGRMHAFALSEDAAAAALFTSRGYAEVRRFYDMAIELDAPPPDPVVPEGLVLDDFRAEDAHGFQAAVNEAFEDHWDWHALPFDEWWELRKDDDQSLWYVVRDGDEIAAAVRNETGRFGGGYVGIIGVRRAWRGRGLAKALLHRSFTEFWHRGFTRVTLGVDAESPTGATKLYESVGMHVESTIVVFER